MCLLDMCYSLNVETVLMCVYCIYKTVVCLFSYIRIRPVCLYAYVSVLCITCVEHVSRSICVYLNIKSFMLCNQISPVVCYVQSILVRLHTLRRNRFFNHFCISVFVYKPQFSLKSRMTTVLVLGPLCTTSIYPYTSTYPIHTHIYFNLGITSMYAYLTTKFCAISIFSYLSYCHRSHEYKRLGCTIQMGNPHSIITK